MIRNKQSSRTLSTLLLLVFSAAGLFGPSLHSVSHFAGSADIEFVDCGCGMCPVSQQSNDDEASNDSIKDDHDCAICRFLALAKQSTVGTPATVKLSRTCLEIIPNYEFSPVSALRIVAAPRGPPLSV